MESCLHHASNTCLVCIAFFLAQVLILCHGGGSGISDLFVFTNTILSGVSFTTMFDQPVYYRDGVGSSYSLEAFFGGHWVFVLTCHCSHLQN